MASEQRPVDAHVLHQLEPRLRVEEGVDARHDPRLHTDGGAGSGTAVATLRDVAAVAPGDRDPVERRVRDVLGDVIPQREFGAAVHLDVLHRSLVLRRKELGERVLGLVQVVVGIEGLVRQPPFVHVDQVLADMFHGALRVVFAPFESGRQCVRARSVSRSAERTHGSRMRVCARREQGRAARPPARYRHRMLTAASDRWA